MFSASTSPSSSIYLDYAKFASQMFANTMPTTALTPIAAGPLAVSNAAHGTPEAGTYILM